MEGEGAVYLETRAGEERAARINRVNEGKIGQ